MRDLSVVSPFPDFVGKDPLDFVLILNSSLATTIASGIARRVLRTAPDDAAIDDGLLIRAQYHAQQRQSLLYPFNNRTRENVKNDDSVVTTCMKWSLMSNDSNTDSDTDRESYKREIWESCDSNGDEENKCKVLCREDIFGNDSAIDENEIDLDHEIDVEVDTAIASLKVPHLLALAWY
jgi:hypothetical protein